MTATERFLAAWQRAVDTQDGGDSDDEVEALYEAVQAAADQLGVSLTPEIQSIPAALDEEITVIVTRSAGTDGVVLVMIDTTFEPSAPTPGLRVLVNDEPVFVGLPHEVIVDEEPLDAPDKKITVKLSELAYIEHEQDDDPEPMDMSGGSGGSTDR